MKIYLQKDGYFNYLPKHENAFMEEYHIWGKSTLANSSHYSFHRNGISGGFFDYAVLDLHLVAYKK